MPDDKDLQTPEGRLAIVAARLVSHMRDKPGVWDFLEVFRLHMDLIRWEIRREEARSALSTEAAEHGKHLYLVARAHQCEAEMAAARAKIYEAEHGPGRHD